MIRPAPPADSLESLLQTGLSQLAGCPSPLFEEIMKHPQPNYLPLPLAPHPSELPAFRLISGLEKTSVTSS